MSGATGGLLAVRGLAKSFPTDGEQDGIQAVDGTSFEVGAGQLFTLLGPSGCGKTTTLRCVAGLERADAGEISLGERVLFRAADRLSVPANRRGLGMVFQSYGLWPHMTVLQTVSFPLAVLPRARRPSAREIRERAERALSVVRLGGLESRAATDLSGGQQQRLALARALVIEPPLLLMDEPLSNLDARLREDMRLELKRLQRELGVTALYVTHDQAEALALSNRVAVMRSGRIEQVGKPREVYERPASRFVAEFLGSSNLIEGIVREATGSDCLVEAAGRMLKLRPVAAPAPGGAALVSIRPEQIELRAGAAGSDDDWRGTVRTRAFNGDSIEHVVAVGELELRARSNPSASFPPGTDVVLGVPERECWLVPGPPAEQLSPTAGD
jgi:iron(III) transport system ATP-binding protein